MSTTKAKKLSFTKKTTSTAKNRNNIITCSTCRKFIKSNVNLRCALCKNVFDLPCAQVTTKNFNQMTTEIKAAWICSVCNTCNLEQTPTKTNTTSTPSTNARKPFENSPTDLNSTLSEKSLTSTHEQCVSLSESLNEDIRSSFLSVTSSLRRSLPDLSTRHNEDTLNELKQTNRELKQKLESANLEIENLILEKNRLERKIKEQELKINNLMRICSTGSSPKTPKSARKNKHKGSHLDKSKLEKENDQRLTRDPIPLIAEHNFNVRAEENERNNKNEVKHIQAFPKTTKPRPGYKKINIFGTQQTCNLASNLIQSRINNKYQKYEISAITKPGACAAEVLSGCLTMDTRELDELDKVIICVGENDKNPMDVLSNLHSAVKKLRNCSVIVINVLKNKHINTQTLNDKLSQICKNNNCHFINNITDNCTMTNVCDKINRIIDIIDYEFKYLNFAQLRKYIHKSNHTQVCNKKGTIPYFFSRMQIKSKQKSNENSYNVLKKGTIPYYFPVVGKKFFRD